LLPVIRIRFFVPSSKSASAFALRGFIVAMPPDDRRREERTAAPERSSAVRRSTTPPSASSEEEEEEEEDVARRRWMLDSDDGEDNDALRAGERKARVVPGRERATRRMARDWKIAMVFRWY